MDSESRSPSLFTQPARMVFKSGCGVPSCACCAVSMPQTVRSCCRNDSSENPGASALSGGVGAWATDAGRMPPEGVSRCSSAWGWQHHPQSYLGYPWDSGPHWNRSVRHYDRGRWIARMSTTSKLPSDRQLRRRRSERGSWMSDGAWASPFLSRPHDGRCGGCQSGSPHAVGRLAPNSLIRPSDVSHWCRWGTSCRHRWE